jgi:ABC-type nickel/cobalt efflux system permease component RcnA
MESALTLVYFPTALLLGALHALEPGHAKTLTAAYLIGIKGTKRDAVLLGLSVAATHSMVVIVLAATALWVGREAFADQAMYWLQLSSGAIVVSLGAWMLWRRWPRAPRRDHVHDHGHDEHGLEHGHDLEHRYHHMDGDHDHPHGEHYHRDHDDMDEDEHARAHAATLPDYARRGERPTGWQILAFGAAGGMIPCPASVTVMLLALSVGRAGMGMLTVLGFSVGLALTLVGVGVAIVLSLNAIGRTHRLIWVSRFAPVVSAGVVLLSGTVALLIAQFGH